MTYPIFSDAYRVQVIEGEGVLLVSERRHHLLSSHACRALAPLLDGTRTVSELVHVLADQFSRALLSDVLSEMERLGFIVDKDASNGAAAEERYWMGLDAESFTTLSAHPPAAAARNGADWNGDAWNRGSGSRVTRNPTACSAEIEMLGAVSAVGLAACLERQGIAVGAVPGPAGIQVFVCDSYVTNAVKARLADAWRGGRPHVLVRPIGTIPWIGPLFVPWETTCGICMLERLRMHQMVDPFSETATDVVHHAKHGALEATRQLAFDILTTQLVHYFRLKTCALRETLFTLDTQSLALTSHRVADVPTCSRCGSAGGATTRRLTPSPFPTENSWDSGLRRTDPARTLDLLRPVISPITGAIRSLEKVSGEMESVHVYIAQYIRSPHEPCGYPFYETSVGKGPTDAQAQGSALGEAIERLSSYYRGDEPRHEAARVELGEEAVDPNVCMCFSESQYAHRPDPREALRQRLGVVPERFPDDVIVPWSPVRSLQDGSRRLVPMAYCYYAFPDPSAAYCLMDSNGHAAGITMEEAILQALLELVERDSVAMWWYNRVNRPAVDLDSFSDPYVDRLRHEHDRQHRDLWVLDVTSDLEIPVCVAISASRPPASPNEPLLYGFGAHLDVRIALNRALTEMNQALPAVLRQRGCGGWMRPEEANLRMDMWPTSHLVDHPYLSADPLAAPWTAGDYTSTQTYDLRDDIHRCLETVASRGLDVLVLDQTRADLGLHAVKVIVPGLRGFARRFAPGRLYDVPVSCGWRAAPLSESDMNPEPIVK